MRKHIMMAGGILAALMLVVGIAWALWQASVTIKTSLQVSSIAAPIVGGSWTNDDGIASNPVWEGNDIGPDPATAGPGALRYDKNIALCLSSINTPNDSEANLTITKAYGGYWCTAWFHLRNDTPANWTLNDVTVNDANFPNCPAMGSVDIDGDTALDIEACVSQAAIGSSEDLPILGVTWAPNAEKYVKLALHVLDSVTPGKTLPFVVSLNGPIQTGGP